ncbi:hypothetical protein SBF1_6460003 [Candidatus Desulfosporosinus infrequens]|uniref:Uncharacterized protein n=1 Tax=Candidatus Desulfosporosinus infrequens TaxID=2043169 RepID=A0A2U3LMR1_9FIRM|nr:hypothetical protein SBF1_6460003 [Candidatus Desulfosporosinus infrequens]
MNNVRVQRVHSSDDTQPKNGYNRNTYVVTYRKDKTELAKGPSQ